MSSSIKDYVVLKKKKNNQTTTAATAAAAAKQSQHVHHGQQDETAPAPSAAATTVATTATSSIFVIPSSKRALFSSSRPAEPAIDMKKRAIQFVRMKDADIWQECHAQFVAHGVLDHFVDVDFPPMAQSLDGRKRQQPDGEEPQNRNTKILCKCGQPAAPRQVHNPMAQTMDVFI